MPTALVLLDLSAVFDTIDHRVLLNCLSSRFALSGVVLDWFASYLADGNQCVQVGNAPYDLAVLGPILFSFYTTSLNKYFPHTKQ